MARWPFPGDSPIVRARKVALAYREELRGIKPEVADEMDERFQRWGEMWIAPVVITWDDEDWISTKEAAGMLNVNTNTLSQLRIRGRIKGRKRTDGVAGMEFKVAHIRALSTTLRGRGWRKQQVTDSVTTGGSSVSDADRT